MTTKTIKHPAKFTDAILAELHRLLPAEKYRRVLDPFAGTGRIHELNDRYGNETIGIELEPEWAAMHERTACDDARHLRDFFGAATVDAIATSPCYGNRMADDHTPSPDDTSERHTYRHYLGHPLSDGSAAGMQWGAEYRAFHEDVWAKCVDVLRVDGRFVLNVKDHIRGGAVMPVVGWHTTTLCRLGLRLVSIVPVAAPGQRHGANGAARVDHEFVLCFVKERPAEPSLFDAPAAPTANVEERFVRANDPSTSRAAADGVVVRAWTQLARLLVAFDEAGDRGLTSEEAGVATRLIERRNCCYWRRVSSLHQQGWLVATDVERVSTAGSPQRVLVISQRGRDLAGQLIAEGQTKFGRA